MHPRPYSTPPNFTASAIVAVVAVMFLVAPVRVSAAVVAGIGDDTVVVDRAVAASGRRAAVYAAVRAGAVHSPVVDAAVGPGAVHAAVVNAAVVHATVVHAAVVDAAVVDAAIVDTAALVRRIDAVGAKNSLAP